MVNRIEELEKVIAKLQSEIEVLRGGGKRWRAEEGGEYWVITGLGEFVSLLDDHHISDDYRYSIGNYFRTKAEAQRALDRMIATQQIKDRIAELNAEQGWVADWIDMQQDKYIATLFEHKNKRKLLATYCGYSYTWSPIEFYGSKQTIETIIKEMPKQIKLWLGVE